MAEVTLEEVLAARERRAVAQQELIRKTQCPIVSFCMNIAGPIKSAPAICRAFEYGLDTLLLRLPFDKVREVQKQTADTGCEALLAVDMPAERLKALCSAIEEETPLGRLFDMDVLDVDGHHLTRATPRGCLVCGAPGRACAAGRLHTVEELQEATRRIITEHFAKADADTAADRVVQSLLFEVDTTPKPGLVDRRNCGSHTDMDRDTFIRSAQALRPYFAECFLLGLQSAALPPAETFTRLREAGLRAETVMYEATDGVNTHKGAVYSFGILCGSLGRLWSVETPFSDREALLKTCADVAWEAVRKDLESADDGTAGLRCYRTHGLTGVRGEAAAGFPSVTSYALPVYLSAVSRDLTAERAGTIALLHLIANVQDTALYHRGGPAGAVFAAEYARSLLKKSDRPTREEIEAMDDAFIARNLSPGGCADLLAITYFLSRF